jgi:NADPH-dependent curcumin reductase CurA
MTINRQWLLAERPTGIVGEHNFKYAETPLPEPKHDEVLVKNLFLSFDHAQRNWMEDRKAYLPPVAISETMIVVYYNKTKPHQYNEGISPNAE